MNKKKALCIAAMIVLADQWIKAYIRGQELGRIIWEVPGVIRITNCWNTGAAFSLFSGQTALLTAGSLCLLVVLWIYACRAFRLGTAAQTALVCLIGGGVGNLIDRAVFGAVTDYIELLVIDFPIFNFADIVITVSVGVLMTLLFTGSFENTSGEAYGRDH